ncbi:MAG: histidine kinase [Tabrizicola sp.]|jgi:Ca2+-binding EF-hand superfamily protein|uniref:EF-hand domain-containing protein n=1 Tax=Tabrizicola sp. TaxID=2005166 RepID=UPI003BB0D7A2
MSAPKKSAIAAIAVIGALLGTAALAQKGEMGMGGPGEGRGAMLTEMFDTMDADKDGKLTYAEMEAHRKVEFAAADTNGDGVLSPEELSARALARFQEKLGERTQGMLDTMDNDGNGSLSEAEMGEGPGMRNFARIDADNDGFVTRDEIQAGMKHHKKRGHGWGMGDN